MANTPATVQVTAQVTTSPKHKTLAAALAAFQAEVPKMSKDETAKVKGETKDGRSYDRSYGYAGLDQFVEIVEPALGKHGMSVTSRTTFTPEGVFMLEVSLVHESGERETAYWPLPDPRRAGPQDLGSAMTYGRRYLGWGLTGTFPSGIDDDGKQAQAAPRESWDNARPVQRQAPVEDRQAMAGQEPQAPPAAPAPRASWTDAEVYDYQAKMGTVTLDSALKAYDWMASKDLHNREVGHPTDIDPRKLTATTVIAIKLATLAQDPESTPAGIEGLKAIASNRGLMKVMVSPTDTLEQALHEARELAVHAVVEQAKRQAAQDIGADLQVER
jgi:hypothetical protein